MKKYLLLLLALVVAVSCMIFPISAEDTDGDEIYNGLNVALEADYERTGQHANETETGKYAFDEEGALTDGVVSPTGEGGAVWGTPNIDATGTGMWVGFHSDGSETDSNELDGDDERSINIITVDLGEQFDYLTKFVLFVQNWGTDGFGLPSMVNVYVSEDNDDYKQIGTLNTPILILENEREGYEGDDDPGLYQYEFESEESARYIMFEIYQNPNNVTWTLASEVQVYQNEPGNESSSEDESSEDSSDEGESSSDESSESSVESSEESSQNIKPGDNGSMVYIVIALAAVIAASLLLIKKRKS